MVFLSTTQDTCQLIIARPVGWGGSRGSNEPPKIFEVGILGGIEKIEKFTKNKNKKNNRLWPVDYTDDYLSLPGLSEEAATFWYYNETF